MPDEVLRLIRSVRHRSPLRRLKSIGYTAALVVYMLWIVPAMLTLAGLYHVPVRILIIALTASGWTMMVVSALKHYRANPDKHMPAAQDIILNASPGELARIACLPDDEIAATARVQLVHELQTTQHGANLNLKRAEYTAMAQLLNGNDVELILCILKCIPEIWDQCLNRPLQNLIACPATFNETAMLQEAAREASQRLHFKNAHSGKDLLRSSTDSGVHDLVRSTSLELKRDSCVIASGASQIDELRHQDD